MSPLPLAALDPKVVRPRDLRDRYVNPPVEARRLAARGDLLHLAHGYYAVVPEAMRGTRWRPSAEGVGLGIAQRDGGRDNAALMGVSAARVLGVVPRGVGRAVIAIANQRPSIDTLIGPVTFVTRTIDDLDVQQCTTDLATGWTTTPDQTALDLADRPSLAQLPRTDLVDAILAMRERIDWDHVDLLARDQRKTPGAIRAAWLAGARPRRRVNRLVDPLGFTPATPHDPSDYGIRSC